MYSLLIVDDDAHDTSAVKNCLSFEEMGITRLYTAQDITAAKKLIAENEIHILLCDIEMPGGNGLELLSYIREQGLPILPILLTCHTNFKYAHQAIKLGCLDYLLKPVNADDLRVVLEKAVQILRKDAPPSPPSALWHKDLVLTLESFWLHLINNPYRLSPEAIQTFIESMDLPLTMSMRFFPLSIRICEFADGLTPQKKVITEYAIRRFIGEVICDIHSGHLIRLGDREFLVLLLDDLNPALSNGLESLCRNFIQACADLPCRLFCTLGASSAVAEIADHVALLRAQDPPEDESSFAFLPFFEHAAFPVLDISTLCDLIKGEQYEDIRNYIQKFLQEEQLQQEDLRTLLHFLWHDFISAMESACSSQNITLKFTQRSFQAHFPDPRTETEFLMAVDQALQAYKAGKQSSKDTLIESALHYINEHLDEDDLSREMIAQAVFISPDYLSRLFKQKMGSSITDYIISVRIKEAEYLLLTTNYSVSTIANMVGYSHFSHFTKMFRLHTGCTPRDYRNRTHQ